MVGVVVGENDVELVQQCESKREIKESVVSRVPCVFGPELPKVNWK